MVPKEVIDLAKLIEPHFDTFNESAQGEVIKIAQRIWNAGWRPQAN
jgi:hypothetical protein